MKVVRTNGLALHWKEDGDASARPVLFANSLGTDLRLWDEVIPLLPSGYRYVRYDKRGHGLSECPAGPYSLDDLIADAEGLIESLELGPVVFIGLSVGGMIGQGLALKRPDLVKGLVLSNTAAKMGSPEMWQERILDIRSHGLASASDKIFDRWFGPNFRRQSEAVLWREMLIRTPLEGYLGCCAAIADTDFSDDLGRLNLPVQGIAGDEDNACTADQVISTCKQIAGSSCQLVQGAGHLPCVEKPESVAKILSKFLKENFGTERYSNGMCVRRSVLGDAHVDRAEASKSEFDKPFQDLITQSAWGTVWADKTISRRERSMITLALLAATGNFEEIPMHVRACSNTGASADDIMQAFMHVAVYAGVPKANHAIKLAKATIEEEESET